MMPDPLRLIGDDEPARPFDEIWSALVDLFGEPTSSTRSLHAKVARELADRGATAADVYERAAGLVARWGDPRYVTVTSLLKHWPSFDGRLAQITPADVERHRDTDRYRRLTEKDDR